MSTSGLNTPATPRYWQRQGYLFRTLRVQLFIFALLITSITVCAILYLETQKVLKEESQYLTELGAVLQNAISPNLSEAELLSKIELVLSLPKVESVKLLQNTTLISLTRSDLSVIKKELSRSEIDQLKSSGSNTMGRWFELSKQTGSVYLQLSELSLLTKSRNAYQDIFLIALSAFVIAIIFLLVYLEGPVRAVKNATRYAMSLSNFPEVDLKLDKVAVEFEELEEALNQVAGQLKIKEANLILNNKRLAAVLDHAVDGIMTVNAQGELELVNPASQRIFGFEASEMIGQPIATFIQGLEDANSDPSKTHLMTIVATHKDGHTFPIEASQSALWFQEKALKVVVVRDLSERHLYERALQESEAKTRKLSLVASRTSNAVLITDSNGRIEWLNDGFSRLTEYNLLDVKGKELLEVMLPHDAEPKQRNHLEQKLKSKSACQLQVWNYDKKGKIYWVDAELQAMLDQDEQFSGFMVIATDITEQLASEKLLKQERDFAQAVMATVAQGITVINKHWKYEYVNPAHQEITGFTAKDLLGKQPFGLSKKYKDKWNEYKELCETNTPSSFEISIQHAEGRMVDVLVTSIPRFEGTEFLGVIATVTDITQSKQESNELIAAKELAEAANKAKNEFLSRMSHELRTPLNAILGFAQLLELDELNQDQSENVDRILGAGRHLLDLINEVLDISRIETGSISLTIEPVLCERIVKECITLMQPLAKGRRVKLELEPDLDKTLSVMGDHQRLKQVLINLLSNGIKYNQEAGQVFIGWQLVEGHLKFSIRDTGSGIPESKLDRLFIPFDRLGAEHSSVEGSGIGLALTQRLVEVMGGKISVASKLDQGSSFFVELPAAPKPIEDQQLNFLLNDAQLRVIYVEDDLPNVALVRKIFSKMPNTQLRTAMQGEVGLKLIREELPQLVLLDLNLPDISGEEVLRQLKSFPETQGIPIIILSADATETTTERLLAAGAFAYLYKPVNIPKLMQLVESIRFEQLEKNQTSAPVETLDLLRLAQKILKDRPQSQQLRLEQIQVFQDLQSIVSLTSHSWRSGEASLQSASEQLLSCLARVAESATDPSGKHSSRVANMATLTAEQLGCGDDFIRLLAKAAQLHDLGAMAVTDTILLKPDALTESERNIMQLHCEIGADMLAEGNSDLFKMAADIARSHHERWDGTGYPHELKEEATPLAARIVAVADVYDALLQAKPYKKAWTIDEALDYITEQAATLFDPDVVVAFLQATHDNLLFEPSFEHELSL